MTRDKNSGGYVDDVPYVRHFLDELAPARLRLTAALNGFTPPPSEDFDYCEIGCAHGDTLVALAAAHPRARFVGLDIVASHVTSAKKLARDSGLENVGVLERDVADLVDGDDVGELDYVVAHGVLSWVSPETRRALVAFAAKKLRPGGLLYVSYNTMPGWASIEPLRQLLLFPGGEGSSLERAERGLAFATAMQAAGADYFAKNPLAQDMLATMTRAGLPYVVHEYLHEHWSPMYFARVAWEMGAADLHFAGTLPLYTTFADTVLPESSVALLSKVDDRITFESLKDFAVNETFRRDVYVKGTASRQPDAKDGYLDTTPWGTTASERAADSTVRLPHRTISLTADEEAVFEALLGGGARLADLPLETSMAERRRAIVRLASVERVLPLVSAARAPSFSVDARLGVPLPYNQTMLRRLASGAPLVLASTRAGTGFAISALEALAVRAVTEVEGAGRAAWVDNLVARNVLRLRVGDRAIEAPEEQRLAIREAIATLASKKLGKMLELGILAP